MNIEPYRESWKQLSYEERKNVKRIRELNDRMRKTLPRTQDMIIVMGDLKGEPPALQSLVYATARAFDAFTEDNDPWGEHDCASFELEVEGRKETFMFKIDYYDLDLKFHSPDPGDPLITRRVMTLMYARDR